MQDAEPLLALMVPRGHREHVTEPLLLKLPAGQGTGKAVPAAQEYPGTQGKQAFPSVEYSPAGQRLQVFEDKLNEAPGLHFGIMHLDLRNPDHAPSEIVYFVPSANLCSTMV